MSLLANMLQKPWVPWAGTNIQHIQYVYVVVDDSFWQKKSMYGLILIRFGRVFAGRVEFSVSLVNVIMVFRVFWQVFVLLCIRNVPVSV